MYIERAEKVGYKIYFRHQIDFPFHIHKTVADANSKQHLLLDQDNNVNLDRGITSMQILW